MRVALVASLAAVLLALQGRDAQLPVFRASQDMVSVFVTVMDKSDRLVPNLTAERFQVFDNGQPQAVTTFDNTPQPVHLVVMLDVSGSMYGNLPIMRAACQELFSRLGPDDLARVGVFGRQVSISSAFTRNISDLVAALPTEIDPLALTPLWLGVDQALTTLHDVVGRRVIVVLSDGKDNPPSVLGNRIRQVDVVARARRDDVMMYAIGLRSYVVPGARVSDMPDPGLALNAVETGGGYFEIRPGENLPASFARVVTELHSQYLLGFSPPAHDGLVHQIEVRLVGSDLVPRARKSYLAPTD